MFLLISQPLSLNCLFIFSNTTRDSGDHHYSCFVVPALALEGDMPVFIYLCPDLEGCPAGVQTLHCYLLGHQKGSRGERIVYHLASVQMEYLQPKLKIFCQNCKVQESRARLQKECAAKPAVKAPLGYSLHFKQVK